MLQVVRHVCKLIAVIINVSEREGVSSVSLCTTTTTIPLSFTTHDIVECMMFVCAYALKLSEGGVTVLCCIYEGMYVSTQPHRLFNVLYLNMAVGQRTSSSVWWPWLLALLYIVFLMELA